MCVMWNSAVKGQILKNQAVTEVLNLEHYIHPWWADKNWAHFEKICKKVKLDSINQKKASW